MTLSRSLKGLLIICLLSARIARADVVVDWNAIASQVIGAGGRPGPSTLIDFAVVHGAVYDALQAYDGRYKPYRTTIRGATGSPVAAAAKAARDVLANRFPSQATSIDATYNAYLTTNGLAPDDPGVAVGATAAAGMIAARANDGAFPTGTVAPFIGGNTIGMWRPTPSYNTGGQTAFAAMIAPWLGSVKPFGLKSASQYRAKRPPELTSAEYAADYNEVKAVGSLTGSTRTQAQTDIAYFWSDNTPLQWHRALRAIATARVGDIFDSGRLFALASFSTADAIITCWESKSYYSYWRPVTAIHEGADDGNPATEADPNWKPLINNPAYPDYTSGANSVTASMCRAIALFFGTDDITFTVTSNVTSLAADRRSRTFTRLSDAAAEVVEARIFLGIHFRFADTEARDAGYRVARWTFNHLLRPIDSEGRSPKRRSIECDSCDEGLRPEPVVLRQRNRVTEPARR